MIKSTDYVVEGFTAYGKTKVRASLVADSSSEVTAIGTAGDTVIGLNENMIMTLGSTCLTADGDFGQLNSTGAWKF